MTTVDSKTATKMTYLRNAAGEFVCPDCGITKARQNTMFYHMKKHAGAMSHVCGVCSKGFIQKSGLQQHMIQAHPEAAAAAGCKVAEWECPCCDHTAKVKSNLLIHIGRKHGAGWVPPVSVTSACTCGGCDKEFSSATAYYYHAVSCFVDVAPEKIEAAIRDLVRNV
jgi:hypothetical protein